MLAGDPGTRELRNHFAGEKKKTQSLSKC